MHIQNKIFSVVQILATLFALLSPVAVRAEVAGVTGVQAVAVDGDVRVKWNAPGGGDSIASYRVYYSQESILENGGVYDDFEETQGPTTEHVLLNMPEGDLFVSVLAVNATGEESPFFLEEATVSVVSSPASDPEEFPETEVSTPEPALVEDVPPSFIDEPIIPETLIPIPPADDPFVIVQAVAVSATGVLVTFSLPVTLAPEDAPQAFTIKDGSGVILPLRRLVIAGNRVEIDTAPQVRGQPYIVEVGPVLFGTSSDPTEGPVSLSIQRNKALFLGHATGLAFAPPVTASVIPPRTFPSSVASVPSREVAEPSSTVKKPLTNLSKSGAGVALALMLSGGIAGWRRMRRKDSKA